ncbi:MAG TPA: MOSC domain-containing protein [Rubricoccaceae bacterium]|jgi:MOSC domain-containing protein YiiM
MSSHLVQIFVAPAAGVPVVPVAHAEALAGRGLAGDRYAAGAGSFSRWPGTGRALTLIAAEALAMAEAEFGVAMTHGEHRRNLVVAGIDLRALLGGEFRIGGAVLRGARVCAPCRYLVRVTGQPRAFDALVGRGGIRAEVVTGGRIAVGDAVEPLGTARPRTLPG